MDEVVVPILSEGSASRPNVISMDEEIVDLDYDEGSIDGDKAEDTLGSKEDEGQVSESGDDECAVENGDKEKEEGEADSDKEEGELEDGELDDSSDSDAQACKLEQKNDPRKKSILDRLSRSITGQQISSNIPASRDSLRNIKEFPQRRMSPSGTVHVGLKNKSGGESAWERGLREAREAMKRASKKREEPDFETKRLRAAPMIERGAVHSDSDESTRHVSRTRSTSPVCIDTRRIPSLLDLPPMAPAVQRRIPPKDLGPQVRYPNGRAAATASLRKRNDDREWSNGVRERGRRDTPPCPENDLPPPRKESRPVKPATFSPSRDASPISSDSDASVEHLSRDRKPSSRAKQQSASTEAVNDPWARKKSAPNRKRQRTASKSSVSSDSERSRKRAGSSSSRTSNRLKRRREQSPPRGDIADYRIPKKRQAANNPRDTVVREARNDRSRSDRRCDNRGKQKFDRNVVSTHNERRNRARSISGSPVAAKSGRKGASKEVVAEQVSSSEDDSMSHSSVSSSDSESNVSRSRSSSRSSRSASPASALPARYRVTQASSPSPVSDDDLGPSKKKVLKRSRSRSRSSNDSSRSRRPTRSRSSSPVNDISGNRSSSVPAPPTGDIEEKPVVQRKKIATPPPPPPPYDDSVETKPMAYGEEETKPPVNKGTKQHTDGASNQTSNDQKLSKDARKAQLLAQLKAVEEELKKKRHPSD